MNNSTVALALALGVLGAVGMNSIDQRVSMVDQVFNMFISRNTHDLVGDDGASEFVSEGLSSNIRDLQAEGDSLLLGGWFLCLLLLIDLGSGLHVDRVDGGESADGSQELHGF